MRVLVAGAGGAIGRPIVRHLVSWGHEVWGIARGNEGAARIAADGATPIIADVLDLEDVTRAVAGVRPEVVIDQLTALPRHYSPQAMRDTLASSNEVRVRGGANVQAAALAAGATRFIAQSGSYFYRPGQGLAEESEPFVADGPPLVDGSAAAFVQVEDRIRSLPEGTTGLVLRYGFYYGPGTWYSPDGDMGEQARAGQLGVLGSGSGIWSFVHVDDAAEFTARVAVESQATGVVNVTDSDPLPMRDVMRAFSAFAGGVAPAEYPITEETDADGAFYATKMRGASNRRAREEFGFSPRRLEWLRP
ncbi:NAD(P)-dependent oxidoreductase [Arthrobacter sp. MSA 4-2]|uniref:NAD-dependent epimerase/dehydratase family protein n=1 Tax=Arthrobacter sp. MSA 4-2 TaxID=2794349 RepID=UPI0018E6F408|nr:NAD(P)-dependent oxidoreductase [Arthrobacter sp. MSA 4-2]MBJ2121589.1 NAD(P)-dependent oxidoreductase [Arthrobacter sp. MSA 4-2]